MIDLFDRIIKTPAAASTGALVCVVRACVVVLAAAAIAGCDAGAKQRYEDADFFWGFAVDSPAELRGALTNGYHMADTDADCAVEAIFTPEFQPNSQFSGAAYAVNADLLETAIIECDIDTDTIWRYRD